MRQRDQLIISLRREGYTLREIGERCGISGEGVRRILLKYPRISRDNLFTRKEVARQLGVDYRAVGSRIRELGIELIAVGRHKYLNKQMVDLICAPRQCRICSKEIPRKRWVYCSDNCRIEGGKRRWTNSVQNSSDR